VRFRLKPPGRQWCDDLTRESTARLIRLVAAVGSRSLTFVADQAGHSVATLADQYAGVVEEPEDKARTGRRRYPPGPAAN
jgi:hypothetical protein